MKKKLFILFQGFGMKRSDWNAKPTYFLSKLKKKGKVFIYHNKWIEEDLSYDLSYLTMNGFMKDVYQTLNIEIEKANEYEWIPIGESFGGIFAIVFCIIYKKYCKYCITIDNHPYFTLKNNKYRIKMIEKNMLKEKFKILDKKRFEEIKKHNPSYLIDYGVISFAKYIQKNIINKNMNSKIYGFYNVEYPDKYNKEFKVYNNEHLFDELDNLKNYKNYEYILLLNVGHMIYQNKLGCYEILKKC